MHSNIAVNESILCQRLEAEAVLLDPDKGLYFGMNEAGRRIWELIGQGCDPASIAEVLSGEYGIDRGRSDRDVSAFIAALTEHGFVRIIPD